MKDRTPVSLARRAFCMALCAASLAACTPLRVVTHSVSRTEADVPAGHYAMDAHHWSVVFDVDHFHYSRFVMRFDRAQATLDWTAGGLETATLDAVIDATSLDTNVGALDAMVKGSQMLDVQRYPEIRFTSTHFTRTGEGRGTLTGNLTIRGVTQPVTLDVALNGYAPNPLTKQPTLGFAATGHFNRSAFGLTSWYPAVGDEIDVRIEAEFAQPVPGQPQ